MSDTGKIIALAKAVGARPDPDDVKQNVEDWLDDHPEATTTVQDGAITKAKLDSNLQGTVDDVDDLKSALNNSDLSLIGRENLINGVAWIDNKYIKGDGTIGDNTSYHMTDKIPVTVGQKYTMLFVSTSGYYRVCAYNNDDSVNTLLVNGSSASDDKRTITFTIPQNSSYIRISTMTSGGAYGLITGDSVDSALSAANTKIASQRKVSLNTASPMVFNTSSGTLTLPRYTYVFVDGTRYSFESSDIVLDYSGISGNSLAVVLENNALAVKAYNNVGDNPIVFRFTKNALNRPSTNDIFYPYYADGTLINAAESNRREAVYVDGVNGNDSNDGLSSSPYATITKGISSNAKRVLVARGTYNETITLSNINDIEIVPLTTPVFSTSVFDVPMIIVNKVICNVCSNILFRDIHANNPGAGGQAWYVSYGYNILFDHCWASNAEGGGFVTSNLYGKFLQCKAWDIGSSTYYNSDGFNLHGYGTTELIDCVAHDCYDDGISHHDGCIATIKGGEFWNCTHGGGIAPANRYCEIDGAYCHDNAWGVQATQADASLYDPYILMKNSVLKGNTNYDIEVGAIPFKTLRCTFDTKNINANASYVEIN